MHEPGFYTQKTKSKTSFAICRCVIKPKSYIYICIVAIDTETERCYCNGWVMFYQFVESEISRSLNLICLNEMKKT